MTRAWRSRRRTRTTTSGPGRAPGATGAPGALGTPRRSRAARRRRRRFVERFDRRGIEPFELFISEFGQNSFKIQELSLENS